MTAIILLQPLLRECDRYVTSAPVLLAHEEEVVGLRASLGRVVPVSHVRSTLLHASLLALRERGRYEEYLARMPKEFGRAVSEIMPGAWIPLEVATAHYQAADALGFSSQEVFEIGRAVSARVQGSALGTVARLAQGAGLSPWLGLPHLQRLWDRMLLGGSPAVYRLGPREARVEGHGVPLARIRYVRAGWRGMLSGATELFCKRAQVYELTRLSGPTTLAYRITWT